MLAKIVNKFTGYLMSGNNKVLKVNSNLIMEILDKERLPLHFRFKEKIINTSIENWLTLRYIDTSRYNFRNISKELNLESDDVVNNIKFRAFSITDNYWLREFEEEITYEELVNQCKENYLSEIALNGEGGVVKEIKMTPELTNIGSFEKCWRYENDRWYLIKKGDAMRSGCNLSEVIASEIARLLNIECAKYELLEGGKYVRCESIAIKSNLENWGSISDNLDDDYIIRILEKSEKEKYLNMIYLDALIRNVDRHEFNFGLETDRETGKVLGISKIYDNNLSLVGVEQLGEIETGLSVTKINLKTLIAHNVKYKELNVAEVQKIVQTVCSELSLEERSYLEKKIMLKGKSLEEYIEMQISQSDKLLASSLNNKS